MIPRHPGIVIDEHFMKPLGLSRSRAAEALGVTQATVSRLVTGRSAISAEMAVRLEYVFGPSAEHWLSLQSQHDLAQVTIDVSKLEKHNELTTYFERT